ncbi:hypothetical protein K469DRAFT_733482 [Zopfia rhizophila CBS 207.26]|uniref:very-long-chain enoyl-CoA reductase n=1 Tax=Zopfia rhizophila CBS 207.26 TaxID=1314779 RepID=A0A6A6EHR3_9PEZI|nr:hypothetical protein K469DRAFT_733482 [Zopfia rhizophila CBS 207.26]
MGVLDLLPHCVSGVYLLYHSDFEKWSFGKLSALREAALALEDGYKYYYMGYYIHYCVKMRYKGDYKPQHVLDPETYAWDPLDGELRQLLDSKEYVSLSRERRLKKEDREDSGNGSAIDVDPKDNIRIDFPLPSAAEAGKAVQRGMSLFDLKVPGLMTVEDIETQVKLDNQAIQIRGFPRIVEAQELVAWRKGDLREPQTLKGIIGELVACVGPEVAPQLVVNFGRPIKNLPESINISPEDSAAQIFQKIAAASKFSIHRLRVTKGSDGSPIPNSGDVTVYQTGLRNRSAVDVKDLGPQIAWRTVFIVEYLGPILIHPLIYYGRPLIYGTSGTPSELQKLSLILIVLHFLKREFETLFVHRFSLATMPARNIFKNSAHYWLFSGVNLAYWIYSPNAPTAHTSNPLITYTGITLFIIGEFGNLSNHYTLKNLRRPGSTDRGIPKGLGFNLVTCPNYMFETVSWVGIWLVNWSLSTLVFLVLAVGQMATWARKKEMRYRKEFRDKYKRKRFFILPGIY